MNLVLQLRGTNTATVKDLMRFRQVVNQGVINSENRTIVALQKSLKETVRKELSKFSASLRRPSKLNASEFNIEDV
jgi:hypothetical protein